MDLLTHVLTGASLSRVGLDRKTSCATATLVISAVLPDIDALYWLRGNVAAYEHHRGFTHTLLAVPVMAAASLAIVLTWRKVRATRPPSNAPRWGLLYLFAVLGVVSHLGLDLTLSYGLQLFAPFSSRWYSLDLNLVVEPYITLALLFGLLTSRMLPQFRRAPIVMAFIALVCIWALRGYEHQRAVAAIHAYNPAAVRSSAFPYDSPFWWHGVIETEAAFQSVVVGPDGVLPEPTGIYYKPTINASLTAAQASPVGRVCMEHSAYPLLRQERKAAERVIRIYDLRWLDPSSNSVSNCTIHLDPNLRPIDGALASGPLPAAMQDDN